MKKYTRLLALLLSAGLTVGTAAMSVFAEGDAPAAEVPTVDECFDDYDDKFDAKNTTLFPTFIIEANSIGEGYVQVQEDPNTGNLYMKSHVFTQVYTAEPVKGAYVFSMNVFQTQGNRECAIFLRAPICGENAFYEKDGSEDGNAACRTGIVVNCHGTSIDVNIKSYSPKAGATSYLVQNVFTFDLPEGVSIGKGDYTNFKVTDNGSELNIYVADNLICRIVLSEPGNNGYARAEVTEPCFRSAAIYDAAGAELATIKTPLVQCEGSTVGWTTRVADMIVDDVYLAPLSEESTDETQPETAPETNAETQPETAETTPVTDAETQPDTTPESETATDTQAETKADTTAETAAPATGGCSGSIAAGGLVALLGAAFVALKKKH